MKNLAPPTPIGSIISSRSISSTIVQLVAPGTNLRGVVIRTLYVGATAGAIGVQVYADTEEPAAYGDSTKRMIFFATPPPAVSIPYSLYVPPGQGVWAVANGNGSIHMTWDVLTKALE